MPDPQTTTAREALARFLMGGSREWQDMGQPYEQLTQHKVRREQPKSGAPIWPEMPMWEWKHGGEAERILRFLGLDPEALVPSDQQTTDNDGRHCGQTHDENLDWLAAHARARQRILSQVGLGGTSRGSALSEAPILARAEAAERLGQLLYYHLERLDPSYSERGWDDLPADEQHVYVYAIWNVIMLGGNDVLLLLANDDAIGRST